MFASKIRRGGEAGDVRDIDKGHASEALRWHCRRLGGLTAKQPGGIPEQYRRDNAKPGKAFEEEAAVHIHRNYSLFDSTEAWLRRLSFPVVSRRLDSIIGNRLHLGFFPHGIKRKTSFSNSFGY